MGNKTNNKSTPTEAAAMVIETFAKTQTDGIKYCPRCGRMSVKERLHTNALSRYIQVYICDSCGTDEAIRDSMGSPLPLQDWAIAKRRGKS